MTSDQMNEIIRKWDEDDMPYESFGGKAMPYIGWFWRSVDFDSDHIWLGIIPVYEGTLDDNDERRSGFMQNNKWDYESYKIEGEVWQNIKNLIKITCEEPTYNNLKAIDDAIQTTLPEGNIV